MYVSFPPGRGSTLPPPSSPADLTPAAARDPAGGGGDGAAAAASVAANRAGELEIIAMDIEEMSRAVFHLTRSNNELREALVETPGDPDFEAAIIENVSVAAKLAKIAELKKIYNAMQAAMGGATARPTPPRRPRPRRLRDDRCVHRGAPPRRAASTLQADFAVTRMFAALCLCELCV